MNNNWKMEVKFSRRKYVGSRSSSNKIGMKNVSELGSVRFGSENR